MVKNNFCNCRFRKGGSQYKVHLRAAKKSKDRQWAVPERPESGQEQPRASKDRSKGCPRAAKSGSRATQEWQRTSFVIVVFVQGFSINDCILKRPRRAKICNERCKSDPRETQEMPKSGQERLKGDPRVAKYKLCTCRFRTRILYKRLHLGAAKESKDRQ